MSPLLINVFKVLFVAVLYGFLWVVVRAIRSHLSPVSTAVERTVSTPAVLVLLEPAAMAGRVISVERPMTVGRGSDADVPFDDPFTSDRHVRFDRVEGRLVIEDLGSTNGTLVNGIVVVGRRTLDRGDLVRVGQTIMEVR
ncbi:MAG: FHA domain-containing protein [Actinomycetota bacterium]